VSLRIGLSLNGQTVRAVAVRDEAPVWCSERELGNEEPLGATIEAVLETVPRSRWRAPMVCACLGPARVQVKWLSGLPPLQGDGDLNDLIRESAGRFFLVNGNPPLTSATTVNEQASRVLAAGFDRETVRAIAGACVETRCKLACVVPTVSVLPAALNGDRVHWSDGEAAVELEYSGPQLMRVRRTNGTAPPFAAPEPRELLDRLGPESWQFADAYGAACAGPASPLAIRPSEASRGSIPRWRLVAAYMALAGGLMVTALSPGLYSRARARDAERQLATNMDVYHDAAGAENQLYRVSGALEEVATFSAARHSPLLVLSEITAQLPNPGAMLTLSLEETGGRLVYLVPDGTSPLEWLERVPTVSNIEIVGPITRELVGGATMARVSVTFELTSTEFAGTPTAGEEHR